MLEVALQHVLTHLCFRPFRAARSAPCVYTPCSSLAVHTLSHPQLLALRRSHARHNRMYGTSG